MERSYRILLSLLAILIWQEVAVLPAWAESGTSLELVEVVPDPPHWATTLISDGHVSVADKQNGSYSSEYSWNAPPQVIGPDGVSFALEVSATSSPSNHNAVIGLWATGFDLDVPADQANAVAYADQNRTVSNSKTVHVKPAANLKGGDIVELKIGAGFIAGVLYKYRVAGTSTGDGGEGGGGEVDGDKRRLAARLDCPPSIMIGELPSLNCHIVITSWRYSADPVEVVLPDALDTFGNHRNGIQLLQAAGNQDVFTWNYPDPYLWGMFVFACPPQNSTVANCIGIGTAPGPQTVNIIVRQGPDRVDLRLDIRAVPVPGGQGTDICGFAVGTVSMAKWIETGREGGVLGCAIGTEQDTARSPSGADARQTLFAGGVIVLHGSGRFAGSAFEVHGCIALRYLGMGGTSSWLGLPVSDEFDIPGGRRSDFEGGSIAWDALTGGCMAMSDGSASLTFEPDANRAGGDFTSFEVIGDRMEMCRDVCAAEMSCVAYTYVRPGIQGPRSRCWLKSAIPDATLDGCCISGIKR